MRRFSTSTLSICLLMCLAAPVCAAVTVTAENVENVTVDIKDAPVGAVLENLRERFGFVLEGTEKASGGEALTVTLSGSLKEILARLLRNWNYVIVSSPEDGSGIAKVVILNASYGAAPPPGAPAAAAKDSQIKQINGE